ncbi:MAG: PQQ-binding-like beta-propeller repeat protein, partial [Candidatus Eisenbacteria bacterium]|nr:PQQ-binding-like beta-propeller repeat protein [Candidatus Latescibacterota bacterium]MBD3301226.1 PQQ-binding-like beta-propeller repeat protein [Candidatus Eisenbacteria bacterium]
MSPQRIGISAAAAVLVVATVAPSAAQQSTRLLWYSFGVENVVSVAWTEDLDGDATPEILFESYDAGAPAEDHLFAISGRSEGLGTVVWSARPLGGPSNSGGYGEYCLAVAPDLTGDQTRDVLYGAAWGNRSAFLLDGTSGETAWSFDTYEDSPPVPPTSGWVYSVASLGNDLTEDGRDEVLFAVGSENDGVYLADGATGEILWRLQGADAFGFVASIDDVDGDGIRDVLALQIDNYPEVFVLSGAGGEGGNAEVVWNRSLPGSPWGACTIDVPGEERATLVVGCWDNQLHGFDAATGAPRWDGNVGSYVMRVVPIRDVDNDGIDDLAVGSWGFAGRIHSGADGSTIWATPVGDDCWTCDPVDDTNGDGIDDLAVGSFNGRAYLMDGATGAILWSYSVGDKILTIRGVPDLTG